jgi:large subunit ribosomal protein L18e
MAGSDNYQLQQLLLELETKRESKLWGRVAKDLKKPARQRRVVNVYKIDKYAKEGETVVVPGKVLSVGTLSKPVSVAAFQFSDDAKKKIIEAQGKVLSIKELLSENPEGRKVRILG